MLAAATTPSEPLDHLCPCCDGEGDTISIHCLCDGRGVITASHARELADVEPGDPTWAPRPLPPVPFTGKMCHDCAFRPDSLERDGKSADDLFEYIARANGAGEPFFCHQGMHHGAQGYVPRQRDSKGAPVGHAVCAGWMQIARKR